MTQGIRRPPDSEHFELIDLADGVYAAIATEGGAAYTNAGIVDLGDQTIVFDTFDAPQAADDLRRAAEGLTGRPTTYIIISHAHADHWCGNQMFAPDVPIITTEKARQDMPTAIGWRERLLQHPEELEAAIREDREFLETETDPRWRLSLERSMRRTSHLQAALPILNTWYPNLTFHGELVFRGTKRVAELREVSPAHSPSDCYLLLPKDRIAFIGDLGFFQSQPFMAVCDPQAWLAQLEALGHMAVDTYMPGHGPLGGKADLVLQSRYIQGLEELVRQTLSEGLSAEEAMERALPAPFDAWLDGGMLRWEANIHSAYERLSG